MILSDSGLIIVTIVDIVIHYNRLLVFQCAHSQFGILSKNSESVSTSYLTFNLHKSFDAVSDVVDAVPDVVDAVSDVAPSSVFSLEDFFPVLRLLAMALSSLNCCKISWRT